MPRTAPAILLCSALSLLAAAATARAEPMAAAQRPAPMVDRGRYVQPEAPPAIATSPVRATARYLFALTGGTVDVSDVSMTLEDTDVDAANGTKLPALAGTRDFVGFLVGIEVALPSGLGLGFEMGAAFAGGDETTIQAPIGDEGDMLELELSNLGMINIDATVGWSTDVAPATALYVQGLAGVRAVTRAVDISFQDSALGSGGASDAWAEAAVQAGARVRLSDDLDLWAAWTERLPRSSGFQIGMAYRLNMP